MSGAHEQHLAEQLYQALLPLCPGLSVELVAECDSSNTQLLNRARAGDVAPCLFVTERQSAGRGRLGRHWASESASGAAGALMFSLGLVLAPRDWSGLSLVVGTALAEALHPDIRIKWPNDLWVHERKLAGILIETVAVVPELAAAVLMGPADAGLNCGLPLMSPRYVVIGVGINLAAPVADGLSTPPSALRELLPQLTPATALLQIAKPLLQAVLQFAATGFAPWQVRFNARDALAGQALRLSDGMTGDAQGVDATGGLLVHTSQGLQTVRSAEVSVRLKNSD
jgi:BirA family transcriptional regulator, biotin operon repressor / biotin---[acetyl-CoA-carboxylase] ligase